MEEGGGACIPQVMPVDSEVSSEMAVTAVGRGVIRQMCLIFIWRVLQ